jgi:signal transduction histidine kinase
MLLKKPFEPIMLRQLTASLTRKWELQRQSTDNLSALKQEVDERNEQISRLSSELRRMKAEHGDQPDQKRAFFADISFKIRTPLTDLFGVSEALQETELSKEQVDYATSINSAVNSMLDQMQDVYDSDLDDSELQLDNVPFSLYDMLKEIEQGLVAKIGSKPVNLRQERSKDLPDLLVGDKKRLKQVLSNLAENAIKYSENGEVLVNATVAGTEGEQYRVRFTVRDRGPGMPEPTQKAILEGDEQALSHGRGLKLVMKILKRMKTKLSCETAAGGGTILGFTLSFKLSDAQSVKVVSEADLERFKSLKVLLVEDNVTNQLVLKGMLSKYGLNVDVVQSGEHAVEAFREKEYDIIYMDWHMPGMDGLETTHEIRKLEAGQGIRTPIIAVTANVLPGDREKCLGAGMDDYLSKPIRQQDIFRTLGRWG